MNVKLKTTLIILVTFTIGIATGVMGHRLYMQQQFKKLLSTRMPAGFVSHFRKTIEPTDEQWRKIEPILDKYGKKLSDMHHKFRENIFPVFESFKKELDPLLTEEQKERLKKKMFRRPGPPGPPGPPGRPGPKRPFGPPPDKRPVEA